MERVAFLIEASGRRIDCLLNPETLVLRRRAGVVPRVGSCAPVTSASRGDDPLLFTGGGVTELDLELLFDATLVPEGREVQDIRDLTRPLWEMTENVATSLPHGRPPLVRFVWGKSWNLPGVVLSVAERLERFSSAGVPSRSWLKLRFRRLAPMIDRHTDPDARDARDAAEARAAEEVLFGADMPVAGHEVTEGDVRLDEIADRRCENPAFWRLLAIGNQIDDPGDVPAGTVLRIPALHGVRRPR